MDDDVLAVDGGRIGAAAIADGAGRQHAVARGFEFADALEEVLEIGLFMV